MAGAVHLLPLGNMPEHLKEAFGERAHELLSAKVHAHKRKERKSHSLRLRAGPQPTLEWLCRQDAFCLGLRNGSVD